MGARRERQELASENETLRQEALRLRADQASPSHAPSAPPTTPPSSSSQPLVDSKQDRVGEGPGSPEQEPVRDVDTDKPDRQKELELLESVLRSKAEGPDSWDARSASSLRSALSRQDRSRLLWDDIAAMEEDPGKINALQLRLDESQKVLLKEREDKHALSKSIEKLETELNQWKLKYEEQNKTKQEAVKQVRSESHLYLLIPQQPSRGRIRALRGHASNRVKASNVSPFILVSWRHIGLGNMVRTYVNTAWQTGTHPPHTDTPAETAASKSQSRRLRERRTDPDPSATQELADMRHIHSKVKKQYQDKMAELAHANRKVEQHETEVKKLRLRVEELKKELGQAEDELDEAHNQTRKLQRSLDEQVEQSENLQVQLEHLQSRLRRQKSPGLFGKMRSARFSPENPDGPPSDPDEEEEELQIQIP
ncbi:unnamed protein product [Oncorhynchus mykiss]|uniref:Myosin tail domain-containing protein n=1 Tax=Oncorhynchus mykiss TaxID=8022 RepID=A0A060XK03_ONCMY|nr:unnamed protein product [Oncorhynchus mykiss]